MDYNNEIEDIKFKIQDIKHDIKTKRNEYKSITSTLKSINSENINKDPLVKSMEIKVAKQDILNEISGEKIGGISQYYYDKLQEAINCKSIQLESKSKIKESKKEMAQTILKEIESLKEEENRLLSECQKLINKSKKYKKQDTGIEAPKVKRRTR